MKISIIIPVLNEVKSLPITLQNTFQTVPNSEVIVVDGGSTDGTREAVSSLNFTVKWLNAPKGRGTQMNAGADEAGGDILIFLHADTLLPDNTAYLIERCLEDPLTIGGFFRIKFSPPTRLTSFYAWGYNLRSYFRIFYGDAALFVRREVFEEMGGYEASQLMEDIELILRLRRKGRLEYIREGTVTTSSRRFPSTLAGIKMLAVWSYLHILMALGVSQDKLEKLYPEKR